MKTAVIVANGPSLADVPNEWLEKYTTFAANRVHLKEGFLPTYLSIFDVKMVHTPELIDEVWPTMLAVKECYVSRDVALYLAQERDERPDNMKVLEWKNLVGDDGKLVLAFSNDPMQLIVSGGTITYVNIQLARWWGFDRLLIVGLDHDFSGPRGDHFHEDYNKGVGIPYAEGNLDREKSKDGGAGNWFWDENMFYSKTRAFYAIASKQFETFGGEIINCTPDTKLDVFPVDTWENY